MDITMSGNFSEELIPGDLRGIYRSVIASPDHVTDERVRIALISVLRAMRLDTKAVASPERIHSVVVPFVRR